MVLTTGIITNRKKKNMRWKVQKEPSRLLILEQGNQD
jgi:hypothetical protein